ncbi:PHP domain-containing protein [Streptomyces anulatus]|uniref:PHP domain-containing protein n=1 Tax=Streptomyces anulatus TaxID=1892 RepID=UPI00365A983A
MSSGFSARYGVSHPCDLLARAAERGIGMVALTDRDMVTGTVRFAKAAMAAGAAGAQPVSGVDLGVAPPRSARRSPPPHPGARGVGAHVAEAAFRATFWPGTRRVGRGCAGWCPPRTPKPSPRVCRGQRRGRCSPSTPTTASWCC